MEGLLALHVFELRCLSLSSHPDPSLGPGCSCMCSVCSERNWSLSSNSARESQGLRMVLLPWPCCFLGPGSSVYPLGEQGPSSVGTGCLRTESPAEVVGRGPWCRGHGQAPPPVDIGQHRADFSISLWPGWPRSRTLGDIAGLQTCTIHAGPRLPQPCVQP